MQLATWLRNNQIKVFIPVCAAVFLFLANLPTIERYNRPKITRDEIVYVQPVTHVQPLQKPKQIKLAKLTIPKQKPVIRTVRSYNGVYNNSNGPNGSNESNGYTPGNCTWYAKSKRPDLPNNLGNAITWLTRARAQGIPTGSTPRVGAVAWEPIGGLGHVAVVTGIRGSLVTISEMNYKGLYVISTRTVPASHFQYIY